VHYGSHNFGTIYLLSGAAGFCFSQIFGGHLSIGASCSVFGIIGAELSVKVLQAPVLKYAWRNSEVRTAFYWALVYMGVGLLGILPIDNWGHLGGFLVGGLLGFFFELWRTRRRLGMTLIFAVVLLVSGLICAARWSVFNPYYHVHQALLAREEKEPERNVNAHLAGAREWARFWRKEDDVEWIVQSAGSGYLTLEWLRQYGYANAIRMRKSIDGN
jgi:membrane associated rhomboid family serine protease